MNRLAGKVKRLERAAAGRTVGCRRCGSGEGVQFDVGPLQLIGETTEPPLPPGTTPDGRCAECGRQVVFRLEATGPVAEQLERMWA